MRLVDADTINYDNTECAKCEVMECHARGDHKYAFKTTIDALPTIDPYVHSYWDDVENTIMKFYKCNHCRATSYINGNYCPNCGAKMDIDIEGLRRRAAEKRECILNEVANIWAENPQLRLGQLITNLGDVYYIENEELVKRMWAFYDGHK